jgi:hypothetical protein
LKKKRRSGGGGGGERDGCLALCRRRRRHSPLAFYCAYCAAILNKKMSPRNYSPSSFWGARAVALVSFLKEGDGRAQAKDAGSAATLALPRRKKKEALEEYKGTLAPSPRARVGAGRPKNRAVKKSGWHVEYIVVPQDQNNNNNITLARRAARIRRAWRASLFRRAIRRPVGVGPVLPSKRGPPHPLPLTHRHIGANATFKHLSGVVPPFFACR